MNNRTIAYKYNNDPNITINNSLHSSNSRVEENAGKNSEMNNSDKDSGIPDIGLNQSNWLPGLDDIDNK